MSYKFQKASNSEILQIWKIIQQAIERRKDDGSDQWQNGYPNLEIIQNDISNRAGFVLIDGDSVIGYCALIINDEPAYLEIKGQWLTNNDFIVVHRVAISDDYLGQGMVQNMFRQIEDFALTMNINSIKVDTNFDNPAMLRILKKLGYTYCGEVYFDGSPRKAFEKVLQ